MNELIILEQEGKIAKIKLNRPNVFNSFNLEISRAIEQTLIKLNTDDDVKVIIITGEGKAFSAGGDLKFLTNFPKGPSAALYMMAAILHQAILEIRRSPKPVIAAINGVAAGGGFSFALACDFKIMAKSAVLQQAYSSSGLSMDLGGTFILPRLIGLTRAMEIIAFDKPITSEQALAWGLVNKVVDDENVQEEALNMATELANNISLNSFRTTKKLLNDSFNTSLEVQLENERVSIANCATHPDGKEGIKAFVEKRKPDFKGN